MDALLTLAAHDKAFDPVVARAVTGLDVKAFWRFRAETDSLKAGHAERVQEALKAVLSSQADSASLPGLVEENTTVALGQLAARRQPGVSLCCRVCRVNRLRTEICVSVDTNTFDIYKVSKLTRSAYGKIFLNSKLKADI